MPRKAKEEIIEKIVKNEEDLKPTKTKKIAKSKEVNKKDVVKKTAKTKESSTKKPAVKSTSTKDVPKKESSKGNTEKEVLKTAKKARTSREVEKTNLEETKKSVSKAAKKSNSKKDEKANLKKAEKEVTKTTKKSTTKPNENLALKANKKSASKSKLIEEKTSVKKVSTEENTAKGISTKETPVKSVSIKKASAKETPSKSVSTKKASTKKTSNKKSSNKKASNKNEALEKTSKINSSAKNKKSSRKTNKKLNTIGEYYDLPSTYEQTIVKILAQTPKILFVYWDVSNKDKQKLLEQYGNYFFEETTPYLLVNNKTKGYQFEVDINDYANSWYLHIPDSDCEYEVTLMRRNKVYKENTTNNIYITSSNVLETPNDHILFEKLGKTVFFKDVKTNRITEKNIYSFEFMHNIGKIYNIYDLYKEIYKDELNGDELGIKLSSSQFSSTFK